MLEQSISSHQYRLESQAKECAYVGTANSQLSNAKLPSQEIPEQMALVGNMLGDTNQLLSALHQRLASVMPPSAPEATDKASLSNREPSSPLGCQLAELARIGNQNNTSLRYLLERIKL